MPFLGLIELWSVDASHLQQSMPHAIRAEAALEQLETSSDPNLKILPFVIEGSVESFDPVLKAKKLAETMPRKWCGIYRSFGEGLNPSVTLFFSKVKPIGQILSLDGKLLIDGNAIPFHGNLNAKSNQVELLNIANQRIFGLEPGGTFLGFNGLRKLTWTPPRLNVSGGQINLKPSCND